jgi:hypothetical protein
MAAGTKQVAGKSKEDPMLNEYHPDKVFWPNNNRLAVTLTFDFQGGEEANVLNLMRPVSKNSSIHFWFS